jgi:transcriptional regulator with XRE-family HTH domain
MENAKLPRHAAKRRDVVVVSRAQPGTSHEDEDRRIGLRIRVLRKDRKLSIERLAEESGLSVGMLSQLERGKSTPSVRSLRVLGTALGVSLSWFFSPAPTDESSETDYIVRRAARRALTLTPSGVYKQLLTPDRPGLIEIYELALKPGGNSGLEFYSHRGEKSGVILSGSLRLWIDDRSYLLEEGDSFRFSSEIAHRFENDGKLLARLIWVVVVQK